MHLGIDTSNYTTSIAIVDNDGIVCDDRVLIKVKHGEKGIRQSDAFFQHIQTIKRWSETRLSRYADNLKSVAVSVRPRDVKQSYMPVFTAGQTIALTIANALGIPLYQLSHQTGHLYAANYSRQITAPFVFLHLSGGTSECHLVAGDWFEQLTLISATADISFGQLVDRVGVYCQLLFPCGAQMERLAKPYDKIQRVPKFTVGETYNLSGYENHFKKLIDQSLPHAQVYSMLFDFIADTLQQIIHYTVKQTGVQTMLLAGGVASNQLIKQRLEHYFDQTEIELHFADAHLATDNAVGVAYYASLRYCDKAKIGG